MIIDRKHIPWAIFVGIATLVLSVLFLAEFHPRYLPFPIDRFLQEAPRERRSYGATPLGLLYGTLALAIFIFASALGIRKKRRLWPIGSVQGWLRAHIWLTVLTIPLVVFHSGGQFGGPHTTTVMWLYIIVMVSGFFGLALQNFLPTLMKDQLSREVVYEQIPHLRDQMVESAFVLRKVLVEKGAALKPVAAGESGAMAVAVDDSEAVLLDFMDNECMPYLQASRARARRSRLDDRKGSEDAFRLLDLAVSEAHRSTVDQMQEWCTARRIMDAQIKHQHWLHGWLLVHVPFSFALLIFTFWHAYVTWIYL